MAGKVLHQYLPDSFVDIPIHPKPEEPDAECVFFVIRVDLFCLNAFLGKSHGIHHGSQLAKGIGVCLVCRYRKTCEGNLFFRDLNPLHTAVRFRIICQRFQKSLDCCGAGVIPQGLCQFFFHMKVPAGCFAKERAPAVDHVHKVS